MASKKIPDGYWKKWENVKYQLVISIKDNGGDFPPGRYFKKNRLGGLKTAIEKYHGGISKVRERLGFPLLEKPKGYWQKWDNVKKELEKIIQEIGHFPLVRELKECGKKDVLSAIFLYFNGVNSVRDKMGYSSDGNPYGYWKNWKNVENELKLVIKENRGVFPTYSELNALGRSNLAHAIQRHYGGINNVRKKLGENILKRKNNSFADIEYVKQQIGEIIDNHPELDGKFPSAWWLQQNGYATIYTGIRTHHGGMRKFRKTIGEKQASLENGTLKNLDFILVEAKKIMDAHHFDEFPGGWTLNKLGYSSLGVAIQKYHGGFPAFREKLNQHLGRISQEQQLTNLLEDYAGGGGND